MKVLVFEDNLMWSSKVMQSLKALGHEGLLRTKLPTESEGASVAIVNLGSEKLQPEALIPALKALGVHVIGHAGHKEKTLLEFGKDAGCDTLATNSELTFKIESLLAKVVQ